MVDAILWDNDGVLVDTEEMFFAATCDALARAGVTLTPAFYLEFMLVNGRNVFDLVEQRGWTPQQVRALRAKRDADYAERLGSGARVMDSVAQTLQLLHMKFRMAVVTTSLCSNFKIAHQASGLLDFFELAVCREDYVNAKPHPEPYLTAMRLLDLPAAHCIVVEDSGRGVKSAVSAGLRVVAIPNSFTRGSDFSGASAVLDSIRLLPQFLMGQ